jgi:hypothetical protein
VVTADMPTVMAFLREAPPVFRRKSKSPAKDPNPYEDLRRTALGAVAAGLAPPRPEHPHVWGVVIDIPRDAEWVTIIALGDGSTSMYTSVGGGTIGAGEHEVVRRANEQLLEVIEIEALAHLDPDPGTHPPPGFVRFHVLGPGDLNGVDVPESAFWGEAQGGDNLVDAAQYLIHTISTVSPAEG